MVCELLDVLHGDCMYFGLEFSRSGRNGAAGVLNRRPVRAGVRKAALIPAARRLGEDGRMDGPDRLRQDNAALRELVFSSTVPRQEQIGQPWRAALLPTAVLSSGRGEQFWLRSAEGYQWRLRHEVPPEGMGLCNRLYDGVNPFEVPESGVPHRRFVSARKH